MASQERTARVNRGGDGEPIGAAVFLSADDLADLGIDPHSVDRVGFGIENGRLRLKEPLEGLSKN